MVAAVVLAPAEMAETVSQEELIIFCKEQLASYKAPSAIWYRDQLLRRLELGKVLRFMLRDEYMKKGRKLFHEKYARYHVVPA